jgi:hypothetical protein
VIVTAAAMAVATATAAAIAVALARPPLALVPAGWAAASGPAAQASADR